MLHLFRFSQLIPYAPHSSFANYYHYKQESKQWSIMEVIKSKKKTYKYVLYVCFFFEFLNGYTSLNTLKVVWSIKSAWIGHPNTLKAVQMLHPNLKDVRMLHLNRGGLVRVEPQQKNKK